MSATTESQTQTNSDERLKYDEWGLPETDEDRRDDEIYGTVGNLENERLLLQRAQWCYEKMEREYSKFFDRTKWLTLIWASLCGAQWSILDRVIDTLKNLKLPLTWRVSITITLGAFFLWHTLRALIRIFGVSATYSLKTLNAEQISQTFFHYQRHLDRDNPDGIVSAHCSRSFAYTLMRSAAANLQMVTRKQKDNDLAKTALKYMVCTVLFTSSVLTILKCL